VHELSAAGDDLGDLACLSNYRTGNLSSWKNREVLGMKQNIFREVSLKRLSSPEQLDQLIKVTSPKGWLALIALGLLLAGVIVWSFLGSISTKIAGQGILLNDGGVFSLTHDTSGQVLDIRFAAGDLVKKGDIIARNRTTATGGKN
jgi:hypothetical protein